MSTAAPRLASVIIPTYHRPEMLRTAVHSALAQVMPSGWDREVVIAVSDATNAADRVAAEELAAVGPGVHVTVAGRLGPAAARNAGMTAATGEVFAFLDDDCEAQPGWLASGITRLGEVDLVQGETRPAGPWLGWAKSLRVSELSLLWETCNLFVRRDAVDRAGRFDEDWNPTGKPGHHWGEDTEWGWRLVRSGATYAFEPSAAVLHAVIDRSYEDWLAYELQIRFFPLILRQYPEIRARFHRGYFLNKRHMHIGIATALLCGAATAGIAGARRPATAMALLGAVPALSPWRFKLYEALQQTCHETLAFGALIGGSIRYRRVLL